VLFGARFVSREPVRRAAFLAPHPRAALAGTITALAVWNVVVRPELPLRLHVAGSLAVAAAMVAFGLWGGVSPGRLGLSPDRLPSGLRYGLGSLALVAAVVLAGVALPWTRAPFHTPRADISGGQLLLELFVTIPLGTVIVEELAFRGTLLALLGLRMSLRWAVIVCSALFGLWHIDTVVLQNGGGFVHVGAAAAGTFAVTSAAGVLFCWLRLRSGSLLASVLAHWATNTVALAAAWLVVH